MDDLDPTDEQWDALGLFDTGDDLAIEAGAGTGKTSTLQLLAESRPKQTGAYLVFNRAAAMDAQRRFPARVQCSTINSLAARHTERALLDRLNDKRQPSWVAAKKLGIDRSLYYTVDGRGRTLAPSWLAGHTMRALQQFCYSADPEPGVCHFPIVQSLDRPGSVTNNRDVAEMLLPYLVKAWADMLTPRGELRYSHDAYLKAWCLGRPQIPVDYVLVDEAQDLSPVQRGLFVDQGSQTVWVGDSQQQIYEWRGAVNALDLLDATFRTLLTRSFRFGARIADLANLVLGRLDTDLRLEGEPTIDSHIARLPECDAVLCRTNSVAVDQVLTYQSKDVPVHLVGGGVEVLEFARAAQRLQEEGRCDHRELGCFESWRSVQEYVDNDPLGSELKLLVNLVDKFGAETIQEALDDMISEDRADVVVSTAHKAKGREWNRVRLAPDFPELADCTPEEFRLFYVAVTRARFVVDPHPTELFHALRPKEPACRC